jgi:hypothetical protein
VCSAAGGAVVAGALAELGRELDALGLAARERRRGLAERDVAEPDVAQALGEAQDLRVVLEELARLLDGHVEHVGDVLAAVDDLERLAVVALAAADLALDEDVRQEVHLDLLECPGPGTASQRPPLTLKLKRPGL